jgi:hypothetical protein
MKAFRDVRRRASSCPTRPVTPEVAGSSPVAPVKSPANRHIVLSIKTPGHGRLHKRAFEPARKRSKAPETPSAGHDFKPVAAATKPAAKASCDYTE